MREGGRRRSAGTALAQLQHGRRSSWVLPAALHPPTRALTSFHHTQNLPSTSRPETVLKSTASRPSRRCEDSHLNTLSERGCCRSAGTAARAAAALAARPPLLWALPRPLLLAAGAVPTPQPFSIYSCPSPLPAPSKCRAVASPAPSLPHNPPLRCYCCCGCCVFSCWTPHTTRGPP